MAISIAQELAQQVTGLFDLVMCHAVLEWVTSSDEVIGVLSAFVKPNGQLSLMFYNQNVAVFKTVLRGYFESLASAEAAQKAEQFVPNKNGTLSGKFLAINILMEKNYDNKSA